MSQGKPFVFATGVIAQCNSTLASSLTAGASTEIGAFFGITNAVQLALPMSCYLIGNVLGPVLWSPLSETYGRRPVLQYTFAAYSLFVLASALAPSFPALVVFRLITGMFGSAPASVVGGLYADIYPDPKTRGRAMAGFMTASTVGPTLGPMISGYVAEALGWRWTFWIGLILAGASAPFLMLLPETYAPILTKTATKPDLHELVTKVLTRPLRMLLFESIVLLSCLYLSLIYAIYYLFFEAYPLVFQGVYGFSAGESGAAFIPMAVGVLLSYVLYVVYDGVYQRARLAGKPWVEIEEYRRLPLALVGGPLISISIFWLAWTARPSIHWMVPVMAGLPFGVGFLLIFMALLNYLADAYVTFAASALGAASCSRSIVGALLPLAANAMYTRLGIAWATSLLGFLSLPMLLIPFAFIRYGNHLRERSKFSQSLKKAH